MKNLNSNPRVYSRKFSFNQFISKKGFKIIFCLLLFFQTTDLLKAQQFNCGSYINRQVPNAAGTGYNTRFDSVSVIGDTAILTQKLLLTDTLVNASEYYNGYIWAWMQYSTNQQGSTAGAKLLKIGKNGIISIYPFSSMGSNYNAATIDSLGIYYNVENSTNATNFTLNRINLTTSTPTILSDKVISLPANMLYPSDGSGDLIFAGGNMYLFLNQRGLLKIDTLHNTSQRMFTTGRRSDTTRTIGSLYLDANDANNIYGYGSDSNSTIQQNVLQINLYSGAVTEIATHGIQTSQTDGASCSSASMFNLVLKGNYFNDADGNTIMQTSERGINGPGNSGVPCATCPTSITKYMNLTDSLNKVIESVPINHDGSYTIFHVPANRSKLKLIASSTNYTVGTTATAVSLNSGWVETGENISGSNAGTGNGINYNAITIPTTPASGIVLNQNFGVEKAPITKDLTTTIIQPVINTYLFLNGGSNPPILTGTDDEDMPTEGVLSSKTIKITDLPDSAELYYNNILVTKNQVINNFDASLFKIKFTKSPKAFLTTSFKYAYVDVANVVDPSPATYTLNWVHPLPVNLLNFSGIAEKEIAKLTWNTSNELEMKSYEVLQSTNENNWKSVNTILSKAALGNANNYTSNVNLIPGCINYFKLKMNNIDEAYYSYSKTLNIKSNLEMMPRVYPTIANSFINVEIPSNIKDAIIKIIDMSGKQILSLNNLNLTNQKINISSIQSGAYILEISNSNFKSKTKFIKVN